MLLGWFDSRQATAVGSDLADHFINGTQPNGGRHKLAKSKQQSADPMRQLLARAEREIRPLQLNFYKRAKLANAFKWRLIEGGVAKEAADEATRSLVMHLSLSETTTAAAAVALPASTPRATSSKIAQLRAAADTAMARGAYDEAAAILQDLILLQPRDSIAFNNLGASLSKRGNYKEAEPYFRRAIALAPNYPDPQSNLGAIQMATGNPEEGERLLRRALKLKPSSVDARLNLGFCLVSLGRPDASRVHFEKVLRVEPRHPYAQLGLGHVAFARGDFAAAETAYRAALDSSPDLPSAWSALVYLRKMTPSDHEWVERAEKIAGSGISPVEEVTLRFAIGKYFDDTSDFERAFRSYKRANDLRQSFHDRYDGDAYSNYVDDLIRSCTPEACGSLEGASASTKPVLVVGMPRSGTSLVEQIIASHPRAAGAGEVDFWAHTQVRHGGPLSASDRRRLAAAYLQVLQRDAKEALQQEAKEADRVVDKTPANVNFLGLIHTVFPQARIIHMRRDPVDTCLSCYFQQFAVGKPFTMDLSHLAHYYRQYHRLVTHFRAVLPPGTMLDVPYAELVSDPETWTRRILEFIGLDWNERCLDFHNTDRQVTTASAWQVRQKIYKTSVERWRHYKRFIGPLLELQHLD